MALNTHHLKQNIFIPCVYVYLHVGEVPVYDVDACRGRRCIASLILNFGARWRWVVVSHDDCTYALVLRVPPGHNRYMFR
jgi:hypothetical protein